MDKIEIVNLLCDLNSGDLKDIADIHSYYKGRVQEILSNLNMSKEKLQSTVTQNISPNSTQFGESPEWLYIYLNFHLLNTLNSQLSTSEMNILSVQQTKNLRNSLQNVVIIGILKNIQPKLPHYIKLNSQENDVLYQYNLLKFSTLGFVHFIKCPNLRLLFLPTYLQSILIAIYQIAYCPLKKPTSTPQDNFIMTTETYSDLQQDKEIFKMILYEMKKSIHPQIFIKETMLLFQSDSPVWFKKSISLMLTSIIRDKDGVENIARALFDGTNDDSTKTWKILDVVLKIILSCKSLPDFKENLCAQVIELLNFTKTNCDSSVIIFERIFTSCCKQLYIEEEKLFKEVFMNRLFQFFYKFSSDSYYLFIEKDATEELTQSVRILHSCFLQKNINMQNLPIKLLEPVVLILFRFYKVTVTIDLTITNREIKELIVECLNKSQQLFSIFDCFLFGFKASDILQLKNNIVLTTQNNAVFVEVANESVVYSTEECTDALYKVLENHSILLTSLFEYLLNCLTNRQKYFEAASSSTDLLKLEEEFMNMYLERTLTVYNYLSKLSENKQIQKHLQNTPDDIIKYINNVLLKTTETNVHKSTDFESDSFQTLFTVLMILHALLGNSGKKGVRKEKYLVLVEPLRKIIEDSVNKELIQLVKDILQILEIEDSRNDETFREKTAVDKAIDDVCDSLLPVRGHGIMSLAKLIEKKDKHAMEKKQYILNIFQQNIKNDDSFIYLNAISGLAAMADVFPDTVINILCEEYSDFTKKDDQDDLEVRMKLGEVLVRVTKFLGEMAPKYKSILLNTFLVGTKDEDHLIRASSLSNLGEICRVLGYKLGTILTEVLVCVHAIITTDKSVEARRAAVTVIRQLFVGLDNEIIAFIKEDILPIYRTLKRIYNNDEDDVMRLQAQLALEELNENMKNFVFPNPQLNLGKNIVMLN